MASILTGGLVAFIVATGISFGFFYPTFKEREVKISENTTASLLQHMENTLSLVENFYQILCDSDIDALAYISVRTGIILILQLDMVVQLYRSLLPPGILIGNLRQCLQKWNFFLVKY